MATHNSSVPTLTARGALSSCQVAMDLSNLGIAYRALGRADVAHGLFERAHKIMLTTLGPADPKTKAIARNLASAQASSQYVVSM